MARLGVVINPSAGSGRGRTEGLAALRLLKARGHRIVNLSAHTWEAAVDKVRAAVAEGLDALVVVGGDGLVHLGVGAVAGTTTPLGLVATGTGNDIPRDLGLPVHDVEAAVHVIEHGLALGPRRVDAVVAGGPAIPGREWYMGVLSAGFDAAVNARANETSWPSGRGRYVRAVAHELVGLHTPDYRVTVDGLVVWDEPGTLVAVANGPSIGGGIRIAPDSRFDDGLLQVVIAKGVSRRTLVRLFPGLYKGAHVNHPAVTVLTGRRVVVEPGRPTDREPVRPPDAFADGERIGPLPLECRIQPGAVGVLA